MAMVSQLDDSLGWSVRFLQVPKASVRHATVVTRLWTTGDAYNWSSLVGKRNKLKIVIYYKCINWYFMQFEYWGMPAWLSELGLLCF